MHYFDVQERIQNGDVLLFRGSLLTKSGECISHPKVDWSHVSIILLAAEQELGKIRGMIRGHLLDTAIGPLERRVAETTEGKAALMIGPIGSMWNTVRFCMRMHLIRGAMLRLMPVRDCCNGRNMCGRGNRS